MTRRIGQAGRARREILCLTPFFGSGILDAVAKRLALREERAVTSRRVRLSLLRPRAAFPGRKQAVPEPVHTTTERIS